MTKTADDLLTDGLPWLKHDVEGAILIGDLIEARVGQARDFDTGEPMTWDDGTPVDQLILDVRVDWGRSKGIAYKGEDKGEDRPEVATLYTKYLQQKAFLDACKASELKPSQVGTFAMKREADGVPKGKRNPPQQFTAQVQQRVASAGADNLLGGDGEPEPETAASGSLLD